MWRYAFSRASMKPSGAASASPARGVRDCVLGVLAGLLAQDDGVDEGLETVGQRDVHRAQAGR